jgi:hypothetical protein
MYCRYSWSQENCKDPGDQARSLESTYDPQAAFEEAKYEVNPYGVYDQTKKNVGAHVGT